jgi:hypothetical protein
VFLVPSCFFHPKRKRKKEFGFNKERMSNYAAAEVSNQIGGKGKML